MPPTSDDPYDFSDLTVEELSQKLETKRNLDTRSEILWEIGQRAKTDADAYRILLDTAANDRSPRIRAEALEEVAETGKLTPEAVERIAALMETERSGEVKLAAVLLFDVHFHEGDHLKRAVPALLKVWQNSRGDVRDHADSAIRGLTGRFATEWKPAERAKLVKGEDPLSGCLLAGLVVGASVTASLLLL